MSTGAPLSAPSTVLLAMMGELGHAFITRADMLEGLHELKSAS